MALPLAIQAKYKAAKVLGGKYLINCKQPTSVGSVVPIDTPIASQGQLRPMSVRLNNLANPLPARYIIGDPKGFITTLLTGTAPPPVLPDTWAGNPAPFPAAVQRTFDHNPIVISSINYEVLGSPAQFDQSFEYITADIDGSLRRNQLVPSSAQRNNQFNPNLLTLKVNYVIDTFRALLVTVNPFEAVSFTLGTGATKGRY